MSGLRTLRSAATKARREARKVCSVAMKEARAIANVRAAMIKANELKLARQACERAHTAALALVAAYNRARPAETPTRSKARARRREKRDMTRRDAIERVREQHQVPERVAELAVVRAERMTARTLPHGPARWEVLAERAGEYLSDAWARYENQMGPPGFVPRRGGVVVKKKKRASKKRGARIQPVGAPISVRKRAKKKRARSRPAAYAMGTGEIIIVDEADVVPF